MKSFIKQISLFVVLSLCYFAANADGKIVGGIVEQGSNESLIGASISVKGTTVGTTTDVNGNFSLSVAAGDVTVVFSYIGYETQTMDVTVKDGETVDVGTISLNPGDVSLSELVVIGSGVIDLTEDRMTPIASSAISRIEIQTKAVGNVEFPEIMKNTPSVYVSNQSGGFGDSQMFLRGFDQRNTAFLLNGQPINGMEDGKMYWSNWAGLSDIANAIQVQRGLGSSKLAISSVGGTVNIVTKATELKKGGFARAMTGNDGYIKGTASYSSGINENGWGYSIMLDYWQANNKWADGTRGQGQNYFLSIGKIMDDHKFNFLIVGAPQWHGQNYTKSESKYDVNGDGTVSREEQKFNNNWGYLDDNFYTLRKNYYHKPIINLNWDWKINSQSNLSTVAYASFGRGGGTGNWKTSPSYIDGGYDATTGLIDWDAIVDYNKTVGTGSGYNGMALRASVNNHTWYGAVTNFEYDTENNLVFNVGADIRFYKGDHFRQLVDLLGLNGFDITMMNQTNTISNTYNANPWSSLFNYAPEEDRIYYDYSENINYQGIFGQAEYANDALSAFIQVAASNQFYQRHDRTNFDEIKDSELVSKLGYNLKGGAAYSIGESSSIFVNTGIYSRQAFLDNIFPSYRDYTELSDPAVNNEQIIGLEAGYKYTTSKLSLNVNAYYTTWKNRFYDTFGTDDNDVSYRTMFTNIGQNHKGIELDARYKPISSWMIRAYTTLGDWKYDGTTPYKKLNTDTNVITDEGEVDLTGTMIGQAPQVTFGAGTSYDIIANKLSIDADYNYFAKFYGYVNEKDAVAASVAGTEYQPEQMNSFGLLDVGATYRMPLGANKLVFRANVYNTLNKSYISQQDSYGIMYGAGTTWNFSIRYNF